MTKLLLFLAIGILARLLPHPANFTPIAAIALFGGTYLTKKQAIALPLIIMILSDLLIGFDSIQMRASVYGSLLISVLLGFWINKNKTAGNIIVGSLLSSIIFFVITNFSVWAFGSMYVKSISGLTECYLMAIPFFKNTLLGDLFYSGLFFGGYELVRSVSKLKILNFKL